MANTDHAAKREAGKKSANEYIHEQANMLLENLHKDVEGGDYNSVLFACDPEHAFISALEGTDGDEWEGRARMVIELKAHLSLAEEYLNMIEG